jgi:hypothetical protein
MSALTALCVLAASCSIGATGSHRSHHNPQGRRVAPGSARAHNPPQIEYLLVLNSNGKPRTSFHPGDIVRFGLEVYSVSSSLADVRTEWQVRKEHGTVRSWSTTGGFTGPTRGNLFHMVQSETLPQNAAAGTYSVTATLVVQGVPLKRSAQFYLHR